MPEYHFGSGALVMKPVSGNLAANPTPMQFGTLQDVSIDITYDIKELYGQKQFPEAIAKGKGKVTGKAKLADIKAKLFNDMIFGQTLSTGQIQVNYDFAAVGATTITIVPPNSGVFTNPGGDMGVRYAANFVPFVKVPSAPAVGQYSVNEATGVYTLNATDVGVNVLITYSYTVAGAGQKVAIANQLMGYGPEFQIWLYQTYGGQQFNVVLNRCVANKFTFATKQEDFFIPELDFAAFADSAGNILTLNPAQ